MNWFSGTIPSVKIARRRRDEVKKARLDTTSADLGAQYATVLNAIEALQSAIEAYDMALAYGYPQVEIVDAARQNMTACRSALLGAEEATRVHERIATRRFPDHFQWIK